MCAKEARRAHIEHSYIAEVAPRATLCEYNIIDVNFAILRAIYYEKLILKNRVPFFSPQSLFCASDSLIVTATIITSEFYV